MRHVKRWFEAHLEMGVHRPKNDLQAPQKQFQFRVNPRPLADVNQQLKDKEEYNSNVCMRMRCLPLPSMLALPWRRVYLGCPACISPVGLTLEPCICIDSISIHFAADPLYPAVSHGVQLYPYVSSCMLYL